MNTNLAIEILKQATIETTTGACEKCPRKDKNKTCIGCLDNAKEQVLLEIERLNNIIKDIEDYINFLVIYNQTISGKFSETQWGQDILGLIGSEKE